MNQTTHRSFSIYKTDSSNQHFVKYADAPEKEITEAEYYNLQELKNKMLDSVISDPVTFATKDNRDVITYRGMKVWKVDQGFRFEYETCYGIFYLTNDTLVVDGIFNSQKGNGEFHKTLDHLYFYSCFELGKTGFSICHLNDKLVESIQKKMGKSGKLVTNTTLYFNLENYLNERFLGD